MGPYETLNDAMMRLNYKFQRGEISFAEYTARYDAVPNTSAGFARDRV